MDHIASLLVPSVACNTLHFNGLIERSWNEVKEAFSKYSISWDYYILLYLLSQTVNSIKDENIYVFYFRFYTHYTHYFFFTDNQKQLLLNQDYYTNINSNRNIATDRHQVWQTPGILHYHSLKNILIIIPVGNITIVTETIETVQLTTNLPDTEAVHVWDEVLSTLYEYTSSGHYNISQEAENVKICSDISI